MRAGHAAAQAQALGLIGQALDMARQRIVRLVAMHVDGQAALGGDLAELLHRLRALRHGPLEMRDAADDIDALVEGPKQVLPRLRIAQESVLGEGDELEIEEGGDLPLHLQQGLDGQKLIVADIDMAADRQAAARDRPAAELERACLERLDRQMRLQLRPELDAFEERAAFVEAGPAEAEGRIHVEMGIDEGRGDQPAAGVDLPQGGGLDPGRHLGDAPVGDRDILAFAAVREIGASEDEIEHQGILLSFALPIAVHCLHVSQGSRRRRT